MVAKRARRRAVADDEATTAKTEIDSGSSTVAVDPTLGVVDGQGESSPPGTRLDRVIHQPVRLSIVSLLAVHESLTFTELKLELETSDGNLSVHARKLEEAGYVDCEKAFRGRTPETRYRLTEPGRKALEGYLAHMEALIRAVRADES